MNATCPRCVIYGRAGTRWRATGKFETKIRIGRRFVAAELACDHPDCKGRTWTTGVKEAVEAGQAVRAARGDAAYVLGEIDGRTTDDPIASLSPQPTLPHSRTTRQPDFVRAGEVTRSVIADHKRKQGGDTE